MGVINRDRRKTAKTLTNSPHTHCLTETLGVCVEKPLPEEPRISASAGQLPYVKLRSVSPKQSRRIFSWFRKPHHEPASP